MSRGFDGFEIDDFRDSGFGSGRDVGRGSSSDWNARTNLHNIHREEDRADRLDRGGRQRSRGERPPLAREERVQAILSQAARTKYTDRDKDYSLRDSEIHTLSEVGKFRVAAAKDLAELTYNGDRTRMENDVESLARQGLVRVTSISDTEHNPMQVVTLTKDGHQFLSRGKILRPDQVTTTDSKSLTKPFTTRSSTGCITRSLMRSKVGAAGCFASSSTTKSSVNSTPVSPAFRTTRATPRKK